MYAQREGFFLDKKVLDIKGDLHGTGECKLVSSGSQIIFYSNGYNQFTKTTYSLETGLYTTDTLFQLGLAFSGKSLFEDKLCASSSGKYIAFYSDNYIMVWDGNMLRTLAGTGVEGTNVSDPRSNELQQVQAVNLMNDQLTVYDEEFSSHQERNLVRILKYKIDLPSKD